MHSEPAPVSGAQENPGWGPDWPSVRDQWPLEYTVAHLDHGSRGAVPTPVLEEQASWRDRMEINPVRFFTRELAPGMDEARAEATSFLGLPADAAVLLPNATTAISTVLASVPLAVGDAVLLTDHGYGAVRIAAERWAGDAGARVDVVAVPLDSDDDEVVQRIADAVTPSTKLAIIDHITSATARMFPVERIVPALKERGVVVLVDAAHGPGMVPVNVGALAPDFWVGNFHTWAFAPRGTSMLAVAHEWRPRIRPLVASWREYDGFPEAFSQQGSSDPTAWLSVPRALRFLERLDPERLRRHNLELVRQGQLTVAAALGIEESALPHDPRVPMQLIPLPDGVAVAPAAAVDLQARIGIEGGAETSVWPFRGRGYLRLSAQAYNCPADYRRLADALPGILASTPSG
jgi:isopenicillin-N epimerase